MLVEAGTNPLAIASTLGMLMLNEFVVRPSLQRRAQRVAQTADRIFCDARTKTRPFLNAARRVALLQKRNGKSAQS